MGSEVMAQVSDAGWLLPMIGGVIVGAAIVFGYQLLLGKKKLAAANEEAQNIIKAAETRKQEIIRAAEVETKAAFVAKQQEFDKETAVTRNELREIEKRLDKREDQLDKKLDMLNIKERNIEKGEARIREVTQDIEAKQKELAEQLVKGRNELLRITQLSMDEAKRQLFDRLEQELERECAEIISKRITEAQDEAEAKSREIIITAIQRYAAPQFDSQITQR